MGGKLSEEEVIFWMGTKDVMEFQQLENQTETGTA